MGQPGYWKDRSPARQLLPEAVSQMGTPEQLVIVDPLSDTLHVWTAPAGLMLCEAPGGREMFILKPIKDAGPVSHLRQALHVERLYERFHHKRSDGYYNVFPQPLRRPQLRGLIHTIRYSSDKGQLDHAYADGQRGEVGYDHTFEAPDFAELYSVGGDQFYIPPGQWRVTTRGIEHHRDPEARAQAGRRLRQLLSRRTA